MLDALALGFVLGFFLRPVLEWIGRKINDKLDEWRENSPEKFSHPEKEPESMTGLLECIIVLGAAWLAYVLLSPRG